jgi:hypothetical protein
VEALEAEVAKLEVDYAHAKLSENDGRAMLSSPDGLVWVQVGKTVAELRAMTLALKLHTGGEPARQSRNQRDQPQSR